MTGTVRSKSSPSPSGTAPLRLPAIVAESFRGGGQAEGGYRPRTTQPRTTLKTRIPPRTLDGAGAAAALR